MLGAVESKVTTWLPTGPVASIVIPSQLAPGRLPAPLPVENDWPVMTFSPVYGEVQSEWTKLKSPIVLWLWSFW